jgi:hypothetical protein
VNSENKVVLLATIKLRVGALSIDSGQPITESAMLQWAVTAQRYGGEPN